MRSLVSLKHNAGGYTEVEMGCGSCGTKKAKKPVKKAKKVIKKKK
jgi:hypothetical protein